MNSPCPFYVSLGRWHDHVIFILGPAAVRFVATGLSTVTVRQNWTWHVTGCGTDGMGARGRGAESTGRARDGTMGVEGERGRESAERARGEVIGNGWVKRQGGSAWGVHGKEAGAWRRVHWGRWKAIGRKDKQTMTSGVVYSKRTFFAFNFASTVPF